MLVGVTQDQPIDPRIDPSPAPHIAQASQPGVVFGGFAQLDHDANCSRVDTFVNRIDYPISSPNRRLTKRARLSEGLGGRTQ